LSAAALSLIKRVDEMSCTIATSIGEQHAATKTIAANVEDASQASQTVARGVCDSASAADEITRNIAGIDQVASQTAAGAAKTEVAGKQLSLLSSDLQSLVGQFRA
jgi:methyl-accepting chemotaxis protein